MRHMLKQNRSLAIHILILFLVFAVIIATNFPFGTWYTGWDNLHPEFNFGLNIKRALSSVWQSYQGTGTYGGHGYAATLPHTLILSFFSIFIPDQYLRSTFTFLMLFLGSLGVFFLTQKMLAKENNNLKPTAGLFAGLFYLLNFATVQNFYIQLEAFIVHYASLPWLFYVLILFLEKKTKNYALLFFAVSFFASVQGFIPPLFVVYMLILGIFLAFYIGTRPTFARIKLALICIVITIFANAYWLFPVIHYSATNTSDYLNAYNNLSSTEDFILKNNKYGNISNAILLKGFLSEAIDFSDTRSVFVIFNDWNKHLAKPFVQALSYVFFAIITIGAVYLIFKREPFYTKAFLISFLLLFSFIATNTPPFSFLSSLLHDFPITKQAFRVSFTKFSIGADFFYSLMFGLGFYAICTLIFKFVSLRIKYLAIYLLSFLLFISVIFFSYPIFTGNLLYTRTKLTIPKAYFELFDFFKTQDPNTRIANLPQGWGWGWSIYKWGYSGSGFLWYGIEQPIMDRAFDVWGKSNENYYWELSYAISSQNFPLIDKIFDKYNINFLIFDPNMIPYVNQRGSIYSRELEEYIKISKKYTLVKQFKSDKTDIAPINIYKVNRDGSPIKNFKEIKSLSAVANIGPKYSFTSYDRAFLENGTYYTSINFDTYYPFRSPVTQIRVPETLFKIKNLPSRQAGQKSDILFEKKISDAPKSFALLLPPRNFGQGLEEANITFETNTLSVRIPKNDLSSVYDSSLDGNFFNHKALNCNTLSASDGITSYFKQEFIQNEFIRFTSINSENCYSIILKDLSQRFSYLVEVESRNLSGKPLKFALIHQESRTPNIEIPLSSTNYFAKNYIMSLPMNYYGLGYSLHFNNISIGKDTTVNDLKHVAVYPIPFDFLSGIKLVNTDKNSNQNKNIFIFYQSYHPLWKAYEIELKTPFGPSSGRGQNSKLKNFLGRAFPFLFGKEIKEHVLVNNWTNGWVLENSQLSTLNSQLIVIFLPQYLEYFGLLLTSSFVFVYLALACLAFARKRTRPARGGAASPTYPHFFGIKK